MPIYLIHGFRWPRNQGHHGIGPHIIMNNVLDAAVNYTMTESSSAALIESIRAQQPDIMAQLPNIRLVEQGGLDDGTQPYAYLCDTVVEHDLSIDLTGRLQPSAGSQWNAMSDLIDVLAPGAKLGWFVVHNDDPFRGGNPPVAYKDTEQARARSGDKGGKKGGFKGFFGGKKDYPYKGNKPVIMEKLVETWEGTGGDVIDS